ncbi:hypothetical protein [Flavisphingomonas formosensis]|uniref:hypothetical protein n=1 Tax=Flavisphingomonas formosensis TaxID=861534 RepID=UPI0012F78860|nr:hypothetical protein [Sphingomonas formosensis]
MKFDDLCSIAHNFADSFGSGASLLFNSYGFYPYDDAGQSEGGTIEIDVLRGRLLAGVSSPELRSFIEDSPRVFESLCLRHGISSEAFAGFTARFTKTQSGREFSVTVVDQKGRCRTDRFDGVYGKRLDARKHPPVTSA